MNKPFIPHCTLVYYNRNGQHVKLLDTERKLFTWLRQLQEHGAPECWVHIHYGNGKVVKHFILNTKKVD